MTKIFRFILKVFTHNYCDTCGFTKNKVYITEYFMESGFKQCKKCISMTKQLEQNKLIDKWLTETSIEYKIDKELVTDDQIVSYLAQKELARGKVKSDNKIEEAALIEYPINITTWLEDVNEGNRAIFIKGATHVQETELKEAKLLIEEIKNQLKLLKPLFTNHRQQIIENYITKAETFLNK